MINLKQFIRNLIPYYQDYSVWYADNDDYKCIMEELSDASERVEIMRKYGKCPVKHVLAGRGEVLHIYLKEGSANNEI